MKKNTLSLAFLLGFSTFIYAQVGINTKMPSTIFDIRAKRDASGNITDNTQTYGLQAPRLTRAELTNNLASYGTDQNGALIYITDISGGSAVPGTQQENVTSVGYYYFDAAANRWQKIAFGSGGNTYTANNGLNLSGNNIKLGGTLTESTTITQGNNPLNITGNSNLNLATTNTSANPLNITYPLNNLANSGILISGASGTPATGQSASIGLNPNASQGTSPVSIGAQYINGSSGQGAADFFIATSSGNVSTKKFVVQNAGNVGIDVTSPNEKLDVNGNVKFRAVPNSSTLDSNDKIMVLASDGTGKKVDVSLVQTNQTTADNGLTKTGNNIQLGGTLIKETTIAQNGNNMIFSGNGSVGIGATTPVAKLDVQGNQYINASVTSATSKNAIDINVGQDGIGFGNRADNFGINMKSNSNNASAGQISRINFGDESTTTLTGNKYLSFSVGKPLNELMYLTSSNTGRVGIGTTTPDAKLDIQGNQYINASVTSATSKNAIDINVGQDGIGFGNRADNFGINMKSNSNTASAGQISRINFGDESTTTLTGNKYLSFSVGKPLNELMYLTSANNGRVGIGTISPSQTLDVNGNVKFRAVPNSSTLNSTDKIMVLESDGTGKKVDVSLVQPNATTANNGLTKTGDNIQLGGTLTKETTIAQNGNNMIFSGNGKLGIGTASPSQKLDVDGSARVANKMTVGSSWNGAALAVDNNVASDPILAISGTSSQRRVTVLDNGNTGIGSQSPSEKLEVAGNIAITPSGGVSAVKFYENSSNGTNAVSVQAPDNLPANRTITLPSNAPLNGYVLMTNSSGVTQWGSVSPPAATLASISLSNENTGSTSVTNGGNVGAPVNQRFFQKFDTTVIDPNNRFNVSNGTYTVSQSGIYMISAYIMPNAAPDKNTSGFFYPVNLEIRKNAGGNPTGGTNIMDNATIRWATPGQTKIRYSVVVTGMVSLSAGDTLNLVVYLNGQNANANATGGYSFPSDFTYAQISDFKALFSVTAL